MKTAHKITIARALYRAVHSGRSIVGKTDLQTVTRDGIVYDLDLSQGIDFALYLGGSYERQTKARLRNLVVPGSLVLDIGANIGAHTLSLAQLVGPNGKVIAFEPTEFAVRKLRANVALNPSLAPRITVNHCYLTKDDSTQVPTAIYSSWPLERGTDRHPQHLGREMRTSEAAARSLDSIIKEQSDRPVHLIKMDVDGYECDVLRGATQVMQEMKPIFVMEIAPYCLDERGASLDELLTYFAPHGYKFYDERTLNLLPVSAPELKKLIGTGAGINIVARA
ncbi:FkbM family methyltransferase [Tardiphaga sp. 1201_B9_N1_1]|jgi:FkbM family methyltransferase|uniref:FkbM family methyltransferase n=1 Tax=unclassified Tardiphaga TaxID=2631404 RepID=UPI003F28728B